MGTFYGGFEIGRKSLQAQQVAMQVTGNNIANINTAGYTRQRAVMSTACPTNTSAGMVGTGVDVTDIETVRDRFLEMRVSQGLQKSSKEDGLYSTLEQVQALFNLGEKGLQEGIGRFFNSFSTLAMNPESTSLRNSVVSAAQNLSSLMQSSSQQLEDIRVNVNSSVVDTVNQINSLGENIAELSANILSAENLGNQASSLRDQRNELLNKLSELIDINYYEAEDGTFSVSVASGYTFVTGSFVNSLTAEATPPDGMVNIMSGANNITDRISGGKLAGLIEARDTTIPTYQTDLDTLAYGIIDQVNTVHALGTDLYDPPTSPTVDFFTPVAAVDGAAAAFTINPTIVNDIKYIAAGRSGAPGDNANALAIAELANEKLMDGNTETFAEAFSSLQFRIGTDVQSTKSRLDTQSVLLTQVQNQRDATSAVSLDDEAIDLMKFQRAYQASAKYVNTIDSLLGDLIAKIGS